MYNVHTKATKAVYGHLKRVIHPYPQQPAHPTILDSKTPRHQGKSICSSVLLTRFFKHLFFIYQLIFFSFFHIRSFSNIFTFQILLPPLYHHLSIDFFHTFLNRNGLYQSIFSKTKKPEKLDKSKLFKAL